MLSRETLEKLIQEQIALAKPMGCQVLRCEESGVEIVAPLSANWNHIGTGFGGSQFALAMLGCWSVALQFFYKHGLETEYEAVVRDSQCRFRRPVRGDFTAHCQWPSETKSEDVAASLRQQGRVRLPLKVEIRSMGESCMQCSAEFVFLPKTQVV